MNKGWHINEVRINVVVALLVLLLSGCSDGYTELGGGYRIVGEGGYATCIVDSSNCVLVPEYILDWAVDSSFILVSQSPPDSLPRMKRFIYTENDRREIADNEGNYRQYWIIEKRADVHGPYNKEQYIEQKAKLHVPQQLQQVSE
jgi:hypothetical protein